MEFIVTGTRAYGPVTDDSDWDIVMKRADALAFKDLLKTLGIKVYGSHHIHPSYNGFYFKFNHIEKVQIIVADDQVEFDTWRDTTEKMKEEYSGIADRFSRIDTFRTLFYELIATNRRKSIEKIDKLF